MEKINIDEWIVVAAPAGKYLGRSSSVRQELDLAQRNGHPVSLFPAFEFGALMRPAPGGGYTREAVVVPIDFVTHGVPLRMRLDSAAVYFCAEMNPIDRDTYVKLVEQGMETLQRARGGQVGLALPTQSSALIR